MEQKDEPKNPQEEEEQENCKKFSDLNDTEEAQAKIVDKDGKEVTLNIDMSSLKEKGQVWSDLELPEELQHNLISKGFKTPSKIQYQVLSLLNTLKKENKNNDIIAQSQNGSGKTLAYLVPALRACSKDHTPKDSTMAPQIVILADTKELIYQIYKIISLIKQEWLKVDYHVKDKHVDNIHINILVTTVDSCSFMLSKKKISFEKLEFLIIDEADKVILNDGGRKNLPQLIKHTKKTSTIGLFSATLPDKCIKYLTDMKREFNRIVVENKKDLSLKNLKHFWVRCDRSKKADFIDKFLKEINTGSVIMFVNSKNFAANFGLRLNKNGHKTEILLSDMAQEDRVKILDAFKSGKIKVLISTNLISRGIDARKVSLVINVDMPYNMRADYVKGQDNRESIDLETYLHRCGRTARFGDMGLSLNLVEDERGVADVKVIEKEYGIDMTQIQLDDFTKVIEQNMENTKYTEEKRKQEEENI